MITFGYVLAGVLLVVLLAWGLATIVVGNNNPDKEK